MRIYVTGVSGFLGGRLAARLIHAGHEVCGSGSSPASASRAPSELERFDVLPLGHAAPKGFFEGFDGVIHAAYDPSPGSEDRNVEGTDGVRRAATSDGVERQLFISSHSAEPGAHSEYGRQKYRLEQIFLEHEHHVARCGLVIGNGGLFQRMMGMIQRLPILPLLDGGRSPTWVTSPEDLGRFVESWLGDRYATGDYNLFNPDSIQLRDLLRATKTALGRRTLLLPVPSAVLVWPLRVAGAIGIPLPVSEENVRGYRSNRAIERASDYPRVLARHESFESMLRIAALEFQKEH